MTNEKIRVFVIAGGQSRRMPGVDKTRMVVEGEPMISRALSMGLSITRRVEVVADRWDRFLDLGIYSHEDLGGLGPVDAWRRAIAETREGEVAIILPVDLKSFTKSWVSRLLRVVEETGRPAAFISPTHGLEPYPCAIPHRSMSGIDILGASSLRSVLECLGVVRTTRPEDFPQRPSINSELDLEVSAA